MPFSIALNKLLLKFLKTNLHSYIESIISYKKSTLNEDIMLIHFQYHPNILLSDF